MSLATDLSTLFTTPQERQIINSNRYKDDRARRTPGNSIVYEDGGQLEDNSRIKVLVGNEIRVRITAPDGKHYYATSGETLEVSYLVTIQN